MLVNRPPETASPSDQVSVKSLFALLLVLAVFIVSVTSIYQSWINNTASFLNNLVEIAAIFFSLYLVVILLNRN